MIFLKINDTNIASPKEISHSYENLDSVERTMDGTMVVDVVGKKLKIDVFWDALSKEDMEMLNSQIQTSQFVSISYRNIENGSLVNLVARPKDMNYSVGYDWTKDKVIWRSVSLSFEEK